VLTSAMTGEEVCTISASRQWTLSLLARAVASDAPSPGGCRIFLQGAAALTAGTVLGDLQADPDEPLHLATVVMSNVEGVYTMTLARGDFQDPEDARGRTLTAALHGGRGGIRGHQPPAHFGMQLSTGGEIKFSFSERPFDRGHCAPPSGGRWVNATGTWEFCVPGIKVVLNKGLHGHFQRGMVTQDGAWEQEQVILMAMVKDGQLDVVQSQAREGSADARRARHSCAIWCPAGAGFLRKDDQKELVLGRRGIALA